MSKEYFETAVDHAEGLTIVKYNSVRAPEEAKTWKAWALWVPEARGTDPGYSTVLYCMGHLAQRKRAIIQRVPPE